MMQVGAVPPCGQTHTSLPLGPMIHFPFPHSLSHVTLQGGFLLSSVAQTQVSVAPSGDFLHVCPAGQTRLHLRQSGLSSTQLHFSSPVEGSLEHTWSLEHVISQPQLGEALSISCVLFENILKVKKSQNCKISTTKKAVRI